MVFVLVNHRLPPGLSTCAHCSKSISMSCIRDLSSQRPYCDHATLDESLELDPWCGGQALASTPVVGGLLWGNLL